MAVPKNRRVLADTEFFHNGLKMRDALLEIMIRDFGVKFKKKDMNFLKENYNLTDEDIELIEYLSNKYHVAEYMLYEFPVWFMEYERRYLMNSIRRFMMHLRYADAIHVRSDKMHDCRRYHIIQAKTECYMIMDEMDYITKVYPVDMNSFLPLIDIIHYEIVLLNKLEKSDNDKYRKWKKKGNKSKPQHTPTRGITEFSPPEEKPIKTPFD